MHPKCTPDHECPARPPQQEASRCGRTFRRPPICRPLSCRFSESGRGIQGASDAAARSGIARRAHCSASFQMRRAPYLFCLFPPSPLASAVSKTRRQNRRRSFEQLLRRVFHAGLPIAVRRTGYISGLSAAKSAHQSNCSVHLERQQSVLTASGKMPNPCPAGSRIPCRRTEDPRSECGRMNLFFARANEFTASCEQRVSFA